MGGKGEVSKEKDGGQTWEAREENLSPDSWIDRRQKKKKAELELHIKRTIGACNHLQTMGEIWSAMAGIKRYPESRKKNKVVQENR